MNASRHRKGQDHAAGFQIFPARPLRPGHDLEPGFGVVSAVTTSSGPERAPVSPVVRSGFLRVRLGSGGARLGWTIHVPRPAAEPTGGGEP
jgi:hypothetical protein